MGTSVRPATIQIVTGITRSYRFRLDPTDAQRRQLEQFAAARRFVWNWALEQRITHYRAAGINLSRTDLNQRQTLPQAAGANTVVLADNDSYLGLAGGSSTLSLSPAEVMELLVEPGLYEPTP